jgi:hypothetical protein
MLEEELEPRMGGDGTKVPMLGGEWQSSEAMSDKLALRLVLARLGGPGS